MTTTSKAALIKGIRSGYSELQRQHFVTIAAIIRTLPTHAASLRAQKESVIATFAQELAHTNRKFDADRFIAACNTKEGE